MYVKISIVEARHLLVDNNGMFLVVVEVGVLRHDVDLHGVVVDADVVAVWHNASPVRHRVPLLGMGGQVLLIESCKVTFWALESKKDCSIPIWLFVKEEQAVSPSSSCLDELR